jgi:isoleucyl-tRNA synthetase
MKKKFRTYKRLNLTGTANEINRYWEENKIFEKSIESRPEAKTFVFYEGPPSANGMPGIHHVLGRTVKDMFNRYKTMQGYRVPRKAGWDTHGLPVELGVEKELGITKEDIGKKISVEEYNEACRKSVMRYTNEWTQLTKLMGYWVDLDNPYITYKTKYIESVWWLLKKIYEKGLLYKGYTIQPYSPKAGTALSTHELNLPGCYRDIADNTVVAQFKVVKEQAPEFLKKIDGDIYILAWTTTPWTLPSNTALAVGENIDYVLVETFNPYTHKHQFVILAKDLMKEIFNEKQFYEADNEKALTEYEPGADKIPYLVVAEFKGKDLLDTRYEQLIPYARPYKDADKAFRVIPGDFVTTDSGTGIVHIAPTFGQDDAKAAEKAGVPPMLVPDENGNPVPLVDLQGRFRPEMREWAGKYVREEYYTDKKNEGRPVNVEIIIKLKEENKAFQTGKYVHSYPHCWRTDKPVLYYPMDSWFIKIPEVRDRMVTLNKQINWKPKFTGEGRFANWLAEAKDWNLSRSRFWGIPLPIWRTEDGKEEKIIGSVAELQAEIRKAIDAGMMQENPFEGFDPADMSDENYDRIDLHKHIVDKIVLVSESGKPMYRESDLIDVWFDSGSMPYAQWHYPFENKELIDEKKFYPADFIAEGVDQTRGWFYTLHAIATMVFDSVAYKNVISNGLVLDAKGQKMSKRLGNTVDPFKALNDYGPDTIRWYMIWNSNPWDNLKFDFKVVKEVLQKFFGTLYNTYAFFALYANLDGFDYSEEDVPFEKRPELDRWILSGMHSLIKKVTEYLNDYEPTKAAKAIHSFVIDDVSNWYVRLSRRRFWKGEYGEDKISAYQTLYTLLNNIAKLMAPLAPFYADRLWMDLNEVTGKEQAESVHLTGFPVADESQIDLDLERRMRMAQQITSLALSIRKKEKIKVRQPLQKIMVPVLTKQAEEDILKVKDLILSEINVKEMQLLDENSDVLVKSAKPDFKKLGPKYGKLMKAVNQAVQNLSQEQIKQLEKGETVKTEIDAGGQKQSVELLPDEVVITAKEIKGWKIASEGGQTIALDITLTPELVKEGLARELVNRIQNIRKNNELEVTDRIRIFITDNEKLKEAVAAKGDYVKSETLAEDIIFTGEAGIPDGAEETDVNGMNVKIKVEKINS